MHVFVARIADDGEAAIVGWEAERPLGPEIAQIAEIVFPMRLGAPIRRRRAAKERQERAAVELSRWRLAEPFEDRRHDVDRLAEGVDRAAAQRRRGARVADDERDVERALE